MNPFRVLCIAISGIALSALFAMQTCGKLTNVRARKSVAEVLFTNDLSGCCMNNRKECNNKYCMSRIYSAYENHIDSAKSLVCVAIYMFTNHRICAALLRAHKRGVVVRIVTETKAFHASKGKASELIAAGEHQNVAVSFFVGYVVIAGALLALQSTGVPVRINGAFESSLMHHKFCLIDVTLNEKFDAQNKHPERGLLLNGSLNWTNSVSEIPTKNKELCTMFI